MVRKNAIIVLTHCEFDSVTVMFLSFCKEMHFLALDTRGIIRSTDTSYIRKWKQGLRADALFTKCQVPNTHIYMLIKHPLGEIRGSVSCPRTLKHADSTF